jgi:NADPH-dependent 2,4-dienoyl-CoA reductase/sulfur reductase-like enzyme
VERKADEPMITVALQNHPNLQADVVVVGAGVRPATDFLKDTFQLEKDGSLKVDAYMRVSGYDNIYAVGKYLNRSKYT